MDPAREVAGALRDDCIGRQIVAQPHHDLAEVDGARHRRRFLAPGEKVGMRCITVATPRNLLGRLQAVQRRAESGRRRVDCEMRMIDAAELVGTGMHMHELGLRLGNIEHAVALRRHFTKAPADQQDQVGGLHARKQLGIWPDAEVAGVTGMHCIDQVAAPECGRDRQRKSLGETHQARARLLAPAAAPDQHDGVLCAPQQILQPGHFGLSGRGFHRLET